MRPRLDSLVLAACGALLLVGCYHATIETGKTASATVISQKWASSFIDGLVPPKTVEIASQCPNGVARVETQHSFLNLLVGFVTFGIYTPMQIDVTCATGGRASVRASSTINVARSATLDQKTDAVAQAAELSARTGAPVFVQF